jgi:transcriptional regulator with XRE-family HTH domain
MPYDNPHNAVALLRAELTRMGLTQAWLARQLGQHSRTVNRWCLGERPVPRYIAFVLHLLSKLHDADARAEERHVEWLIGLLNSQVKPTDTSEAHVAWLLNLIVHGTDLDAAAPVSRVIAARSPYLKRPRRRKSNPQG